MKPLHMCHFRHMYLMQLYKLYRFNASNNYFILWYPEFGTRIQGINVTKKVLVAIYNRQVNWQKNGEKGEVIPNLINTVRCHKK